MSQDKTCENCVHSSRYTVTGELLCLGPVAVIFCEGVEQPCECWEEAKEESDEERNNT